ATLSSIESLLTEKEEWVRRTRARILEGLNQERDRVPFLGSKYNMNVIEGARKKAGVDFDGSEFRVYCGAAGDVKATLDGWYKEELLRIVTLRIGELSAAMGLKPNRIGVRAQKTIWGSCSYDNNISINLKLALAPPEIIDYIIVHELCHIKHKNHSSEFWLAVESVMPDYKQRRSWLKEHGYSLLLF
ncbi:MAG TPA: SprT family zinc-dependent metalloprotease, partial [Clostridiaceae bacterium]|nr:SprT family zinc-dependent metalloprotease [Clostridiaceae bacterium]